VSVYEMIRDSMATTVPFARHTKISLLNVSAGSATTELTQAPETTNHMGSVHAGAIFTLAETAAGGAVAGGFAPFMLNMKAFPTEMSIKLQRPASRRITATAVIGSKLGDLQDRLKTDRKVTFNADVAILSEEGAAIGTFYSQWTVKLRT